MGFARAPKIVLLLGHEDASTVSAGVLTLKGCEVYKSKTADECLSIIERNDAQVDAVLLNNVIASENDFSVAKTIKKMNPDIATVVISDLWKAESKQGSNAVDEFVSTPVSVENLGDKMLLMIAKRDLRKSKVRES